MLAKYSKPPGCADCQLETLGKGFAPPSGPPAAPLCFVGEALGYNEAIQGIPFIGAAGAMFDRTLSRAELLRDHVGVANCVSCQPPGDWLAGAPWQHAALAHCRQYLQPVLDQAALQVVITLGDTALRQVLDLWGTPGVSVQNFHGTINRDPSDRFWVVPSYHPSHLQRGAINLLDVVKFDYQVATDLIARQGRYDRRPTTLVIDPPVEQFRAFVGNAIAAYQHDPGGLWLAVDIETPDKEGGRDESELTPDDRSTQIQRVNVAISEEEGWTVPYEGPYIALLEGLFQSGMTQLMWFKSYDESRLRFRGHQFTGEIWDLMWAAHKLQTDWPLGLGFWAPFASDYGAWKHLGKMRGYEAEYAAIDGVQTRRLGPWIIQRLIHDGLWEGFYRYTHLREHYVLRPAHEVGIGVDVEKLDAFHITLQKVAAERLAAIQACNIAGNLRPKQGYRDRPEGDPPKSIIGKAAEKGDQAKADYITQGVQLVQKEIEIEVKACATCGKQSGVGPRHRCKVVRGASESPVYVDELPSRPEIVSRAVREVRWFWQLPFNPDASQQILKYIKDSGEAPGRAKKSKKDTTNKDTLKALAKKTGDPIYQHILDYKAVKKVDSTYAVGAKKRIWSDGRLHPQYTFRPSTERDSYVSPNIQNVTVGRDGKETLASGFRECIVAAPACHLVEVDFSGIEGVDTGWWSGDPDQIRLSTLGIHAYLTSHLLAERKALREPASLAWSDADLSAFFKEIKKGFPEPYDEAKHVVHGNNYGLTPYGMVKLYPHVFPTLKGAEHIQDIYYALVPRLPEFHKRFRGFAYDQGYIGGGFVDDYTLLTKTGKHHPFSHRHYFHGVQTFRPLNESDYRKKLWVAKNKMKLPQHPKVVIINGRPFEVVPGPDFNRVVADPGQSTAAGQLKEVELQLFHPDSPTYIGEAYFGRTPLRAPIHDSLLMEIPDRALDLTLSVVVNVMRKPSIYMPCPPEWGIGTHLRINVAVKVGRDWGHMEDLAIPDMVPEVAREGLYLPPEEVEYDDVGELETKLQIAEVA